VCPYDTDALPHDVLEEAERSHPLVLEEGALRGSPAYRGVDGMAPPRDPLPPPRSPSLEMGFQQTSVPAVRTFVTERAEEAGLAAHRTADLVTAVNEAATNSVLYGGGAGVVRCWRDDGTLVCEVRDRGHIEQPLVGRRRPDPGVMGGQGLWLAHQLCDLVQLRSGSSGTVVRLHMRAQPA
jgi:anti-sigma regulatory factor (Ser/Thr protein kinase)